MIIFPTTIKINKCPSANVMTKGLDLPLVTAPIMAVGCSLGEEEESDANDSEWMEDEGIEIGLFVCTCICLIHLSSRGTNKYCAHCQGDGVVGKIISLWRTCSSTRID